MKRELKYISNPWAAPEEGRLIVMSINVICVYDRTKITNNIESHYSLFPKTLFSNVLIFGIDLGGGNVKELNKELQEQIKQNLFPSMRSDKFEVTSVCSVDMIDRLDDVGEKCYHKMNEEGSSESFDTDSEGINFSIPVNETFSYIANNNYGRRWNTGTKL